MPISGLCRSRNGLGRRVSHQHGPTGISRRHSLGIVLAGSEALEESQQRIVRLEELTLPTSLVSLCERLFFERQIRIEINLGGLDGLMAQSERDNRSINARLKEFHRKCVAQYMGREPFFR